MIVCDECGGTDIQQKIWIDPNTKEYKGEVSDGESDDNWCEDCQSHESFTTEKEFKKRKLEYEQ